MDGTTLQDYLSKCVRRGASDIFFQAGSPIHAKINGVMTKMSNSAITPRETMRIISEMFDAAGGRETSTRDRTEFETVGDDDFSFIIKGLARFRANVYHQRGTVGAVVRVVTFEIPDSRQINIPESVIKLAEARSGLIIVCGPAGSGKSTTQACMIDALNHSRGGHIITIEDPIEYIHHNDKALITQREVPTDAKDFDSALRAALRQSPDIILLGEMRDAETIRAVVTAAETGHLVIATLHTRDSISAIDRIIDSFPPNQQAQIRLQVSMVLRAVISQRLILCLDDKLRPAFEILNINIAAQSLIRESQTHQLISMMSNGRNKGMILLDESIFELYKNGFISKETALLNAMSYDTMRTRIDNADEIMRQNVSSRGNRKSGFFGN